MNIIARGEGEATGETVERDGNTVRIVRGDNLITRMDELNEGLNQFYQELLDDPNAKRAAEVCVVAFAGDAEIIQDFEPLSDEMLGSKLSLSEQG
ncbi:MAG: hypothetical protein ACKVJU_18875 [Verrucomicrobiales bacterium]